MRLAKQCVFLSDSSKINVLLGWIFVASFAFMIALVTISASGYTQDIFIPNWFLNVYQYYRDGQISEKEFEGAITYLQKIDVIILLDEPQYGPITNFLMTNTIIDQNSLGHSEFSDCSPSWYITGYYTPIESDYTGKFVTASIDGNQYKFREDFATEIKTEGWGKTNSGNYLGWYNDSFHISDFPLDGVGNKLELHSVAVDPSTIHENTHVMIPTLPSPWNQVMFSASDVGPAIIGKHIDVYTGEGKEALDEAYRITGYDNIVCLEAK